MKKNHYSRRRTKKDNVPISSLRITFVLRMLWAAIMRFLYKVVKTIPLFFTECIDCIRRKEWKWVIGARFDSDRRKGQGWQLKLFFFIVILDFDWCPSYVGIISEKKYSGYFRIHLWLCSWSLAKLWRHEGTNMATIFVLDTNQSFRAFRRWLRKINPYSILKRVAVLQAIEDTRRMYNDICNDPMNGCSDDFAEDGDREVNKLWAQYNHYRYCY